VCSRANVLGICLIHHTFLPANPRCTPNCKIWSATCWSCDLDLLTRQLVSEWHPTNTISVSILSFLDLLILKWVQAWHSRTADRQTDNKQDAIHSRASRWKGPIKSIYWFSVVRHYIKAQLLSITQAVPLTFSTNCVFASMMKSLNTLFMRTFVNCQQTKIRLIELRLIWSLDQPSNYANGTQVDSDSINSIQFAKSLY